MSDKESYDKAKTALKSRFQSVDIESVRVWTNQPHPLTKDSLILWLPYMVIERSLLSGTVAAEARCTEDG